MSDHAATVRRFWESCESRDWATFGPLLATDVVYEAPMTRERVRGREGYTRFNREFPGDWHLVVDRIVADADGAPSLVGFWLDGEEMTGISFFTFDGAGLIASIRDFWPEPYEPPADRAHLTERF